jgi:hypothetical protein
VRPAGRTIKKADPKVGFSHCRKKFTWQERGQQRQEQGQQRQEQAQRLQEPEQA